MTDSVSPASDKDTSVAQAVPQNSSSPAKGGFFNNLNIGGKLNIGFGILGALTMLVIALSYLGSTRATTNITRTTDISAPTALASAQAQANLLRMLGDVRGYLALGDEEYRTDYNQAREAFEADIAELEALARQRDPFGPPSTNPEFDSRLEELKTAFAQWSELPDQLFDLRDDQLQREPALRILLQDGNPLIASIVVDIKSMLTTQQQRRDLTPEDIALLGDMANFQASFFAMIAGLRGYVTTGRDNFKFEYISNLTINDEAWEKLAESEALLNNTQQQRLANIGKVREEFLPLPLRMFNAVEGERAREDLYLFRTEAVPLADTMLRLLNEMTLDQQNLLQADLSEGREQLATTQWQIGVGGVIVFFLGLGLAFIFRENIAGPIRRLTGAAEQVGGGDLTVRATVESGDEIGTLAETFNQMTGQLGQTLEDLEQRRHDLQVAAETLRGQNEYLSALHDTSLGLLDRLDLNELLETLVIRAGQLLESPYGYIYLVDPDASRLELKVVVGISERQIGDRMESGEGLAGKVWQSGQPVVVSDYDNWPGRSAGIRHGLIRALAGVPLTRSTQDEGGGSTQTVVGVLGLGYAADSDRIFGDNEVELLSRFAQLASIALDNARLYSEVQDARILAESTNKELSQTLKDLKTTQSQLVEAEKMAALGGLVAGVAHEINTPVGVGVTAASALEDKTAAFLDTYKSGQMKRSDLEKYLNMAEQSSGMILRNLSRAAELIQSFKQVAVDQSTEEQRKFAIKPYLEEILLSLQPQLKKTQHTIEVKGNDDITLESYPGVFSQIVTNLVMNSLLHAYEADDEGHLTFDLKREDGRLIFEYADDGKGISEENLSKIFDPFFTTKRGQGGSGLGLHIIYNLVTQKLGGAIRCESEVGVGTRFVVELPVT